MLPHGLYFGRLEADTARGVARLLAAGELDLDHLRGRSGLATPLQAAEAALRRYVDERRLSAVRFVSREVERTAPPRRPSSTSPVAGTPSRSPAPAVHDLQRLTCSALRENPVMHHEVHEIRAL